MIYLFAINSVVFMFLFVIWNKNDWLNFTLKLVFMMLAVSNLALAANTLGYVVKTL